jgi:hypothetical protein
MTEKRKRAEVRTIQILENALFHIYLQPTRFGGWHYYTIWNIVNKHGTEKQEEMAMPHLLIFPLLLVGAVDLLLSLASFLLLLIPLFSESR